jgi:sulfate adenylyltransferase subunit 2
MHGYLASLEAESIEIIREAIAMAREPVMMYSMGKDFSVLLHLARKAVWPALTDSQIRLLEPG